MSLPNVVRQKIAFDLFLQNKQTNKIENGTMLVHWGNCEPAVPEKVRPILKILKTEIRLKFLIVGFCTVAD